MSDEERAGIEADLETAYNDFEGLVDDWNKGILTFWEFDELLYRIETQIKELKQLLAAG